MVPMSTVLSHSVMSEEGKLFPTILSYLRILYPEVNGPVVSLGWVSAHREFPLVEDGEGFRGDNISNNKFIILGAYVGRFENLSPSIARMNNPSPSLTTFYLDVEDHSVLGVNIISRLDNGASAGLI